MKTCSKCHIEKELTEFFKSGIKRHRGDCKDCSKRDTANWRIKNRSEYNSYVAKWRAKNPDKQHATEIKRHYGLSIEEYNKMLTIQNCQCKICGKHHDPSKKRGRLYVDHCHKNKKVRGLLCSGCNSAIGHFSDNTYLLENAINYLNNA